MIEARAGGHYAPARVADAKQNPETVAPGRCCREASLFPADRIDTNVFYCTGIDMTVGEQAVGFDWTEQALHRDENRASNSALAI